ncbi:Bax inhibitor-1/YccA family protein [Sodalis sp. CWE]|uniref:Bax inhibitor-1/YccA family protein n=1 Tax=Sodalis sp. CWE TaxID=2803816 RepID=UPI001C7D1504|nr:Bax inhibitor-1/YccA family protein [Sodalis sp. CWE]MBX4180965.1 Bax inhibitor-1/YccA family protein [Sodalis sp. CWE]
MERFPHSQGPLVSRVNSVLQPFMAQIYGWMTCGLLLTAFVAWYTARTPVLLQCIFTNQLVFFSLIVAQLALVFIISGMVSRLNGAMATSLFMLHSGLTGLTLSSIFIVYTASSVTGTFVVAAGMFGVMTLYGYFTKQDLSSYSNLLLMALVGIIFSSLMNVWLKSTVLMWIMTYVGIIVFVGLTAYDTQKLKNMGTQLSLDEKDQFRKYSIIGALTLYLDFINLFLMLLRIFGSNRR